MTEKLLKIKKTVLRLMLVLTVALLAGGASGTALVSYAETETVAAEAGPAAETASAEDDGSGFLMAFFGGIILLVLFVVAVTVATAASTAGVVGAGEDE